MAKDKYTAIWVSHSSISDYLRCPRSYYLRNVYRDPKTHHKISLVNPALTLGQVVHDAIDVVSRLPSQERFAIPLLTRFLALWEKVSGVRGGFFSPEEEAKFKARGESMIKRIDDNPGPLKAKAIKIRQDLPYFWLSEEENIILCGKIDWLSYNEEKDMVTIIDFKTGKYDEDPDSLQLPIYYLVVKETQQRQIEGLSYWYLDRDNEPTPAAIPNEEESRARVLEFAKRIKLARTLERFVCPKKDGCMSCKPYEAILAGKAQYIGVNPFGQDLYVIAPGPSTTPTNEGSDNDMPF